MRDTNRIQDRDEVRLDRVQIIWLTLGGVVALGLMFALGTVVGRRAAQLEQTPGPQDPIARADLGVDEHEKLVFYQRLTEPAAKGLSTPPVAPPPVEEPPPVPPPAPPAPEETDLRSPSPPDPGPPPADDPPTTALDADPVRAALDAGPPQPGEFTIQVSAYQSMAEANAFSASLERRGYRPFVVQTNLPGKGTWYRVRLGRFASQDQATRGKVLLAQADIAAWVLKTE